MNYDRKERNLELVRQTQADNHIEIVEPRSFGILTRSNIFLRRD